MVSALMACLSDARRAGSPARQLWRQASRHSRTQPGTRPSGMKMTMATKIDAEQHFQRSI